MSGKGVTVMDNSADVIECDDRVTVEHWVGEFQVTEIDPATGRLHLVGRFLSGWVPSSHAHRIVTGVEIGHEGARCAPGGGA
jgi:hypothetical protein